MATSSNPVFISHDDLSQLLRNILAKGSSCRFQSKGHSMSPFIEDADIVTVSPLTNARAGFGSVVVFICPQKGNVVVHRVVGTKGESHLMRGDNAAQADRLIPAGNILGLVSAVERNGRQITLSLGIERLAVGFLSRMGLLCPAVQSWRWVRKKARNLSLK